MTHTRLESTPIEEEEYTQKGRLSVNTTTCLMLHTQELLSPVIMADDYIVLDMLINEESDHDSSDEEDHMLLLFHLAQNAKRQN